MKQMHSDLHIYISGKICKITKFGQNVATLISAVIPFLFNMGKKEKFKKASKNLKKSLEACNHITIFYISIASELARIY